MSFYARDIFAIRLFAAYAMIVTVPHHYAMPTRHASPLFAGAQPIRWHECQYISTERLRYYGSIIPIARHMPMLLYALMPASHMPPIFDAAACHAISPP